MDKNKQNDIGALWLRKSKDGKTTYLTGVINGIPVVVFKNTFKTEEKHPYFRVYKQEPKPPTGKDNKTKSAADDTDVPFG